MEQLFEPKVLATELSGKKLDLTNKEADGAKFYSKNTFSIEVIQKRQSTTNFEGFKPLLETRHLGHPKRLCREGCGSWCGGGSLKFSPNQTRCSIIDAIGRGGL